MKALLNLHLVMVGLHKWLHRVAHVTMPHAHTPCLWSIRHYENHQSPVQLLIKIRKNTQHTHLFSSAHKKSSVTKPLIFTSSCWLHFYWSGYQDVSQLQPYDLTIHEGCNTFTFQHHKFSLIHIHSQLPPLIWLTNLSHKVLKRFSRLILPLYYQQTVAKWETTLSENYPSCSFLLFAPYFTAFLP